jgi:hypothetical protein
VEVDVVVGDDDLINKREHFGIRNTFGIFTGQPYLDHLFIDQDAVPTFVEVKRSTDTRIRREVVGQMLDYAANAVQYWSIEQIQEAYERNISETNSLSAIGIDQDKTDAYWQNVYLNLRTGKVRFIFVADSIPTQLQVIIEFLNRQMIDTEVLGLEIKQFRSTDGLITLVPHLIGRTVSAVQTKRSESRKWEEDSFVAQAAEIGGDSNADLCLKLLRAFEALGCYIWWGEGKDRGGFVPVCVGKQRHQLCSVYNWYKRSLVEIYFQYMKPPFTASEYRHKLKASLERIPGVNIPADRIEKRPAFELNLLADEKNLNLFIDTMQSYIEDIRASEALRL